MAACLLSVKIEIIAGGNALKAQQDPFSGYLIQIKIFYICGDHTGHGLVKAVIRDLLHCVRQIHHFKTGIRAAAYILHGEAPTEFPFVI